MPRGFKRRKFFGNSPTRKSGSRQNAHKRTRKPEESSSSSMLTSPVAQPLKSSNSTNIMSPLKDEISENFMKSIENQIDKGLASVLDDCKQKFHVGNSNNVNKSKLNKKKDMYNLSDSEEDNEEIIDVVNISVPPTPEVLGNNEYVDNAKTRTAIENDENVKALLDYADSILNKIPTSDIANRKTVKQRAQEVLVLDEDEDIKVLLKKELEIEKSGPSSIKMEPTNATNSQCPVCFEDYGGQVKAMATFCGHILCNICIEQILNQTKKCPTCRKPISKSKCHLIFI